MGAEYTVAQRLWKRLHSRRLGGFKFVLQLAVEPYSADFSCRKRKLIIELDGVLECIF